METFSEKEKLALQSKKFFERTKNESKTLNSVGGRDTFSFSLFLHEKNDSPCINLPVSFTA